MVYSVRHGESDRKRGNESRGREDIVSAMYYTKGTIEEKLVKG